MASVGPMVVWTGLLLNIWVLYILWLGGILPLVLEIGLPAVIDQDIAFFHIRKLTFGATAASMFACLTAQFVDVRVFHFDKKMTSGRYL